MDLPVAKAIKYADFLKLIFVKAVKHPTACIFTNNILKILYLEHPGSSVCRAGAPYTEAVSLLQQPRVLFHPAALCSMSSLSHSPPFPVHSSADSITTALTLKQLVCCQNAVDPTIRNHWLTLCLMIRVGFYLYSFSFTHF